MTRIALTPKHPERVCWGCDRYCPTRDLACGNGSIRTPHPIELFGDDWQKWYADQNLSDAPDPTLDAGDAAHVERNADPRRLRLISNV